MKIAFVTNYFSGDELDAVTASFFKQIISGLRLCGHEVAVFTLAARSEDIRDDSKIHCKPHDPDRYSNLAALRVAPVTSWMLSRAIELRRLHHKDTEQFSPDVILCVKALDGMMWIEEGGPPVALLSVTPQFEIMRMNFDGRFTDVDSSLVSAMETSALRSMSTISCPSQDLREAIAKIAHLDVNEISVYKQTIEARKIPNVVPAPSSQPHVVYVGTFERYKGADLLLDAIPQVLKRFPNCKFTFAGETPPLFNERRPYNEELLEKFDMIVKHAIKFVGPPSHEERLALLASSTVAVFPFRYCGCMYHILEAMSVGACVLTSQVGSIGEALTDGLHCKMISPQDPEILADALIELLSDDALRSRLSQKASAYVSEECSSEKSRRDFEELCVRAVESGRAKEPDPSITHWLTAVDAFCSGPYVSELLNEAYAAGEKAASAKSQESRVP